MISIPVRPARAQSLLRGTVNSKPVAHDCVLGKLAPSQALFLQTVISVRTPLTDNHEACSESQCLVYNNHPPLWRTNEVMPRVREEQ